MEILQTLNLDNLTVEWGSSSDETMYVLSGSINERFNYHSIPLLLSPRVIFQLSQIRTLNSSGVRAWVYFMRQFDAVADLSFAECSVPLLDQLNIVPQMMGNARVVSFYAPYYCKSCDEEEACLIDTKTHANVLLSRQAPEMEHTCGTVMHFDALEDCYFSQVERFLKL